MNHDRGADFLALYSDAMVNILGVYHGSTIRQLVARGADTTLARTIKKLSSIYFGSSTAAKKQRDCRASASANRHTLGTLKEIENQVGHLKDKRKAWQVRCGLTALPADLATIRKRGAEIVAAINGTGVVNPSKAASARRVNNTTYMDFHIRTESNLVTQAFTAAKAYAEKEDIPVSDAACLLMLGNATGKVPLVTPVVVLPLDERVLGVTPAERAHAVLSLSNGARMTVQEFTQAAVTDHGFALTVDHVTGEDLGLFTLRHEDPDARFADAYQRLVLKAKNPVCVADGCGVGADFCQPHHVKAYKNGGKTVTSNLAMLCAYDNGRNDDDPEKPMHGRVEKIDGLEMWVPAFGGDPKLNMHPTALGGAIRLAKKMAEL